MKAPIWTPTEERVRGTNMFEFIHAVQCDEPCVIDYATLHRYSVKDPSAFWSALWDYLGIIGTRGDVVLDAAPGIADARWFPQCSLNFAENHLRRRDHAAAIIAISEQGERRVTSWSDLYDQVSRLRTALVDFGIVAGDRVAAYLPNVPEAVIGALATTSIGAIWSTCSPDYGIEAVIDRLSQVQPKVVLVADGYWYNGKPVDLAEKNEELLRGVASIEHVVLVQRNPGGATPKTNNVTAWSEIQQRAAPGEIDFERFPFAHPLYILFSSGTTGKAKAIVHCAGGTLLQTMKEMVLHSDCRAGEPVFIPTTTGWMVWNLMLAGLAWGSPIVLYDGAPAHPTPARVFDIIADEGAAVARIVPQLLSACSHAGIEPAVTHDLSKLRCLLSGGSPLLAEHCRYVYAQVKSDLHLMSPAGGTDVMAALASGDPTSPVYEGEIQRPSLGMDVQVFDDAGNSIVGRPGELVCASPFPTVPLGFWGLPRQRVLDEYFSVYPGVWRHGDWAEITPRGGVVINGRSDATIKINGVRIATSDIYRGVVRIAEIGDSAAVPFRKPAGDVIVLCVVMRDGAALDDALRERIRSAVRQVATAHHVPELIVPVPDLLRSLNGKPSEVAMRNAINGMKSANPGSLMNPSLYEYFASIPELQARAGLHVAP
jgi:acetoacetyl-CoA synthetase